MDINLEELKGILSGAGVHVTLTGATCIHCATVLPTIEAATAHDAECSKHPIVAERDALRAHVNALRAAMGTIDTELATIANGMQESINNDRSAAEAYAWQSAWELANQIAQAALASTPAQSLAKVKAAVLEEICDGVIFHEDANVKALIRAEAARIREAVDAD